MFKWDRFFHFGAGIRFTIDGPFGYNGEGRVLECGATRLAVRLDLDAWGPAPALHCVITAEFRQEGSGNLVTLERDGHPIESDENATIFSDVKRRERRVSSQFVTFSTRFDEPNELDFDLHLDGQFYPFEFFRRFEMV